MENSTNPSKNTTDNIPVITEEKDLNGCPLQNIYKGCLKSLLIDHKTLKSRIKELAHQIADFYQNRHYIALVVLNGANQLWMDLYRYLNEIYLSGKYDNYIHQEYIKIKSYHNTESSGVVSIYGEDVLKVEGKEVLVIEDIIDTGKTLTGLTELLKKRGAKSVQVFTLVARKPRDELIVPVDFIGFIIPKGFIVGYGLDYNDYMRDIPFIGLMNDHGIEKFKSIK